MLLQHHVTDLLIERIPEGWEEAMLDSGELPLTPEAKTGRRKQEHKSSETDEEASFSEDDEASGNDTVMNNIDDGLDDEDYIPGHD